MSLSNLRFILGMWLVTLISGFALGMLTGLEIPPEYNISPFRILLWVIGIGFFFGSIWMNIALGPIDDSQEDPMDDDNNDGNE